MHPTRTLLAGACAVLAICLAAVTPARATVMTEIALDDMVRGADAIVRGVVTRTGVRMNIEGGQLEPYTRSELRVTEWLSGRGGERVVVRERGGVWQGGGHVIDGTPQYRVGEEVIVFLERTPDAPATFRTYGMAQGKFVVLPGVAGAPGQVLRELSGLTFASWDAQGMQLRPAGERPRMALDTFLAHIRAVLSTYGTASDALGGAL